MTMATQVTGPHNFSDMCQVHPRMHENDPLGASTFFLNETKTFRQRWHPMGHAVLNALRRDSEAYRSSPMASSLD